MELTLLMLFTGTLAVMALIGSVTPDAVPHKGALSDLDTYILDNASAQMRVAVKAQVEDPDFR